MKKTFALSTLILCLLAFGATDAQAGCLVFDGFCDGLELFKDPSDPELLTGSWQNFDCAGSDAPVIGSNLNKVSISETTIIPGTKLHLVIDKVAGTVDLWAWDMVSPPFVLATTTFTWTGGAAVCAFLQPPGGESLAGLVSEAPEDE